MTDDYYFDEAAPLRVKQFAEQYCKPSQGTFAYQPVKLTDWQFDEVVKPFYGWKRKDHLRKYRRLSLWIPRRNGKSFLMSILALYHLCADREPGAYVICVANSIDQARIIFDEAAKFVQQSDELKGRLWVRDNIKTIEYKARFAKLQVISADKRGKLGKNYSAIFFDEPADHGIYQRDIYNALTYSQGNRSQPILATISSAGHDLAGLGYELYHNAKAIKEGHKVDPETLPVIYEANPTDPWDSLDTAKKCNPSFGIHIHERDFTSAINEAKNNPRMEAEYKTYRLNLWQGTSQRWIPYNIWDQCKEDFDESKFHHFPAYIGLDGARRFDLAAYSILIPHDGKWYCIPRFFMPEDLAMIREKTDHVTYKLWASNPRNSLFLTPGNVIDPTVIKTQLLDDIQKFQCYGIWYDPNLIEMLMIDLRDNHGVETYEVPQHYSHLSQPSHYFEQQVHTGKFRIAPNEVANWCVDNCSVKRQKSSGEEQMMPDKSIQTKRIDFVSATVIGMVGAMTWQDIKITSSWI